MQGYTVSGEGRLETHCIVVQAPIASCEAWAAIDNLLDLVRGWKSCSVTVSGVQVGGWSARVHLGEIMDCHSRRGQADRAVYCSARDTAASDPTHLGCQYLHGACVSRQPGRSWDGASQSQPWYRFGSFADGRPQLFIVDKQAIVESISAANARGACQFCPSFSWGIVEDAVASLPDSIDLATTDRYEATESALRPGVMTGIRPSRDPSARLRITVGGPSAPEPATRQVPATRYADIGGQDEAIAAVKRVVELPLRYPEYMASIGVLPQSGILLHGPPGNGKTLLARAVAGECQAHLEIINGPEVVSKWVGQTEENLRAVFERARTLEPSVLLVDEIDSLVPKRDVATHEHTVQMVSQILVLLDGLEDRGGVAVLATTNRLGSIDPAILRPGRFDYHVAVPMPSDVGRRRILEVHAERMRLADDVDLDAVSQDAYGLSGAELAYVCREAGMCAVAEAVDAHTPPGSAQVWMRHFVTALGSVRERGAGPPAGLG